MKITVGGVTYKLIAFSKRNNKRIFYHHTIRLVVQMPPTEKGANDEPIRTHTSLHR